MEMFHFKTGTAISDDVSIWTNIKRMFPQTTDVWKFTFSVGSVSWFLSRRCSFTLGLGTENIRKKITFGLNYAALSPQTQMKMSRHLVKNIQQFHSY